VSECRYTIWQCTDWCCQEKPHTYKWWNVGIAPGRYGSVRTWQEALTIANTGQWFS
jgi:hypothetical protein